VKASTAAATLGSMPCGGAICTRYFRSSNNDGSSARARIMADRTRSSAPVRVDLAGGWTDVGPYPRDFGGEVVNFAINKRVRAISGADPTLESVELEFEIPRGAGLGSSSAMNVAIAGLLSKSSNDSIDQEEIAEMAFKMESENGLMCGRQDHWASARGGFNHLLFIGDSVEVLPFEPARSAKMWLHRHLLLAFCGQKRDSRNMQEKVWSRYLEGDESVIGGLNIIRTTARQMATGIQQDRRDMVVNSMREVCRGVDMIDPSIHDPFRAVLDPIVAQGSLTAWKALGAGGGGCSALLCSPNSRDKVRSMVEDADWQVIEWDYEDSGIEVTSE